jgi:hypothetical protein
MTSRQRFHDTMRFNTPDRVPYFEEGIRKDVLKTWYQQGLSPEVNISDLFQTDHFYEMDMGLFSRLYKHPTESKAFASLMNFLNSECLSRFWIQWQKKIRLWSKREDVLFLTLHRGFFLSMGVYDWREFTNVIYLLIENPDFVRETMFKQGEFIAKLVDKILRDINIDAVIFSEPIGGNEGPLISPTMYEEFVLKSYQPILDIVYKHGIDIVILRTYANIRLLIPSLLKYGFNCLWACETNSLAMDYRDLRKEFGRDLRLIGGLDLDVLRKNKAAIRKEIEEKVPPLIKSGGYIPLADGRVRKDIPFENYLYYRRLLEEITGSKNG